MKDTDTITATIAGGVALTVSLLGVLTTYLTTRWQLKAKSSELEQIQLKDVLGLRMKAYPKLWCIAQTYISDWSIEKKTRDAAWANEFLTRLNACHAKYGVFFSQPVYASFFKLREVLISIVAKAANQQDITEADVESLEKVYSGENNAPGLATHLKQDLGSYRPTIFERLP